MDKCVVLNKDYNPITKRCNVKCKKNQTRRAVDFKCVALKNAQANNAKLNCAAIGKELNPYTNRCNVKCKKNQIRRQSDFKCISNKAPITPVVTPGINPVGTPVVTPVRALTRETAMEKIRRFTRRANYKFQKKKEVLDAACKDSSICLVLGSPVQGDIKSFFDQFINFRFLVNVKKIGKESVNGFIHELKYTHRGYDAYAIIKSSQNIGADNLMYEYRVGQYINTQIKIFPCFLETYGLFSYGSEDKWRYNKNTDNIPIDVFKTNVENINYDLGLACRQPKRMAVMIQHIKNATVIQEVMTKLNYTIYASNLLAILYQIYFPLSFMNFTHYDLHNENVMLYTPDPSKYIHYHYHHPDGRVVSFKSIYVSKLIDYGRCYFNDGVESSNDIYNKLCTTPACNVVSTCGKQSGFNLFKTHVNSAANFFVQSSERNLSHDLRYLKIIKESLIKNALKNHPATNARDKHIKHELDVFFKIPITYTSKYGTSSLVTCAPNICNVSDVVIALEPPIRNILAQVDDLFFNGLTKLGDMHIYSDGRPFTYN